MKQSRFRNLLRLTITCLLINLALPVLAIDATTESERVILVRIAAEMEYLQSLAGKAQASSDSGARVRFDYAALLSDLEEIQAAVERHASSPQRTPRRYNPLNKHYSN